MICVQSVISPLTIVGTPKQMDVLLGAAGMVTPYGFGIVLAVETLLSRSSLDMYSIACCACWRTATDEDSICQAWLEMMNKLTRKIENMISKTATIMISTSV